MNLRARNPIYSNAGRRAFVLGTLALSVALMLPATSFAAAPAV